MSEKQMREAQARTARQARTLQLLLWRLEEWMMSDGTEHIAVQTVTVRTGIDRGGEFLVIVKGKHKEKKLVGFHSASDPETAIRGALERMKAGTMKMREDTPYQG